MKRAFWSLCFVNMLFVISYIFFVQSSVFYMLSANELSTLARANEADLSKIESEYFVLSKNLNIELAYAIGLVEVRNPSFAKMQSEESIVGYKR